MIGGPVIGDGTACQEAAVHAQSPLFRAKVAGALAVIGKALKKHKQPYVAFSGGKDSLVVLWLVEQLLPTVAVHWSDDELEFPETVRYMEAILDSDPTGRFTVTLGGSIHAGWFRPWQDEPFWREPLPGTLAIYSDDVDEYWASNGYDLTFLGLRANENVRRQRWLLDAGPIYKSKTGTGARCCPIWDWSEDDVWAAIAAYHLPYNPAYDTYTRAGIVRRQQRVGPVPLCPRRSMELGWPELLEQLEARYQRRWID